MPVAERSASTLVQVQQATGNGKKVELDPSDPRVKKLVYTMYRDMLTNYSDEASAFIDTQDPATVTKDGGVLPLIQNILRGGGSGGNTSDFCSVPSASQGGSAAPPPPPPPMAPPGAIPAVRLNSEIGSRDKGPPAALAGAMMKDKKPFTYTPGGIDLSEIRSPRMAKRLQMNAAAEGVTSTPKPAQGASGQPQSTHGPLPPAAMAAMQPQLAFCVFPQGAAQTLHKTTKPHDYTDGSEEVTSHGCGVMPKINGNAGGPSQPPPQPPPPPPPQRVQYQHVSSGAGGPPPPPPMQMHIQREPEVTRGPPPPPPQAMVSSTPIMKQKTTPPQQQSHFTPTPNSQQFPYDEDQRRGINSNNVGQGSIYIQPLTPPVQRQTSPPRSSPQQRMQTKAQAASQNLGSIYIPPVEQLQGSSGPVYSSSNANATPSTGGSSSAGSTPQRTPQGTMQTPQLKKTHTPWMNSYNKMATKQAESPPYVNPGNISTPWGIISGGGDGSGKPCTTTTGPGMVCNIPISMSTEDPASGARSPEENKAKAAQHLGRVIPIQIQRQTSLNKEHQIQAQQEHGWPTPRTIPIQIESRSGGQTPTGNKRSMGPAAVTSSSYNNPMGLYSGQNVADAHQQQTGELASGINNMKMEQEREPIQSKSMRVIQKAAENELRRLASMDEYGGGSGSGYGWTGWPQQDAPCGIDMNFQDDQSFLNLFNAQADDGSFLHNTTEPRFRGGHIPSKAFKTLQTTLPPSDTVNVAPPQNRTSKVQQSGSGPVMHNIPIQMSSSPTPAPPIPSSSSPIPPSEQRAASPKKYMGSNIPSRSFKMLQAMTAPDDPDAVAAFDASSSDTNTNMGSEFSSTCPSPCPNPSSYMTWYYWWYYVTCYWAGYDMTGYDYPEGWDPSNPYFPPELASTFPGVVEGAQLGVGVRVPQILVEQETEQKITCDSDYYNDAYEIRRTEDDVGVKCETETEDDETYLNYGNDKSDWSEEEDNHSRCNTAIIEEPSSSTHASEDSDAATLVDDTGLQSPSSMLLIEEYFSSSESEGSNYVVKTGNKHFLSTIEELTDEASSRGSTPRMAMSEQDQDVDAPEEEDDSEESSSDDEASSVSVIENKSASQSQQSMSKREDETSSSSSSGEEDVQDEEDVHDDGEDDNAPAVTVRLPLKLSFGKTKSYKDITTVLVGDVGVGEIENEDKIIKDEDEIIVKEQDVGNDYEDIEEEPVVSFTISLSRQTSREDKTTEEKVEKVEEEEIDFWSQIVGSQTKDTDKKQQEEMEITVSDDYWGSFVEEPQDEFKPVDDFWGVGQEIVQSQDNSSKEPEVNEVGKQEIADSMLKIGKSPSFAKIGTSWDTEFNFWDKSLRTIETRRFSGNFEISEDYESDSGMKSDSGQRHRERRHKVKKYKRHSVPVGLPVLKGSRRSRSSKWDKSQPHPFSFVFCEERCARKSPEQSIEAEEVEIKTKSNDQDVIIGPETNLESNQDDEQDQYEPEPDPPMLQSAPDNNNDLSVGWSSWDYWDADRNATANEVEDMSPDVDVQISLPLPVDRDDEEEEEAEYEEVEEQEVAEENEPKEESNVNVYEEKAVGSGGTEESSEDSSKSSGTTVKGHGGVESEIENNPDVNSDESYKSVNEPDKVKMVQFSAEPEQVVESHQEIEEEDEEEEKVNLEEKTLGKPVEIIQLSESIKLASHAEDEGQDRHNYQHQGHGGSSGCTCHIDSQLSRAESLLWRIERFLHESLSLGSEDDSGVMTDLSRPISDVDTDPDDCPRDCSSDNLLATSTAATNVTAASNTTTVVTRRQPNSSSRSLREQAATNRANPNVATQPQLRRPRPQSLIMLESSTSRAEFQESSVSKPRSRSAERKRYQKAKTHSRLFQLLQDECCQDGEEEDEFFDCEQLLPKTPLSFLHSGDESSPKEESIPITTTATQLHVDVDINVDNSPSSSRRSRLLPLPLKGILLNNFNNHDTGTPSNSSPSGSSGVLSPTSPQTRDRLLADIINEFHLRQKSELATGGMRLSQSGGRFSKFPSKIFKLLQEEFGEEFYQTFEVGDIGQQLSPGDLFAQSHFSLVSSSHAHCIQHQESASSNSIVKSDSAKSTTSDFLEVPPLPIGGPLRRRDFRTPKSPFNKN